MTSSVSSPSPLVPGLYLDRYELLCPIAKGGMAEVWIARLRGKHGFQKLVAIKTILPEYAADPTFQTMFLDEAHISAGIEHVNVAHILDLGEQHDVLYIVMEFVDGESLSRLQRAVLKKGFQIPHGVILRILADTCSGLHAAHELKDKDGTPLNVVHRDVSPQNILVTDKGVAKLIDFGVAKARDRVAGETNAGILKGKVQYMPPEQAMGGEIDRRADVFAIGAIAYHLLVGRPPYDGENQLAMLRALTSGDPPPPLPAGVPMLVADVVMRALAFQRDDRWATALELQRALEAAMVESNLATSTADVGAFVSRNLHERSAERKRAIDLALEAAAERERMQALMAPRLSDHGSSLINLTATSMAALAQAPIPTGNTLVTQTSTGEAVVTNPSIGSIGVIEALGSTASVPAPEPAKPKRRALAIVVGATVLAIAGALVGVSLGRRSSASSTVTVAAQSPRPETTTFAIASSEPSASASASEAPSPSASPSASGSEAPAVDSAAVAASASIAAPVAPVVAATSMIAVTPTTSVAPKPFATAKASAAASASAKPAPTKIDDGF